MDDKEYYSLMNRSSSWALQQALKKQNQKKSKNISFISTKTYTQLELRQGQADAQMLMEKQSEADENGEI